MQEADIAKMKVADLKRELKIRGLSTIGNKIELQSRLQSVIDEGDEFLDESVLTDEDEANILEDENDLLQSPSSLKINITESKDEDELLLSPSAPKKIVLKRKNSFKDLDLEESTISKENTKPTTAEPKVLKMSERNPIKMTNDDDAKSESKPVNVKLSQLSEKERLEMRAKKFGQTTTTATDSSAASIIMGTVGSTVSADQIEKLKKRAERFGVVSPAIAKLDEKERLLKRKERFGGTEVSDKPASTDSANSDVWSEKARQRLERFKTTVVNKE